jgi:hypothetical protein
MEDQNSEFECDLCVYERDQIHGSTFAQVIEYPGTSVGSRLCEYALTFLDPSGRSKEETETRAHREMRLSRGKMVPPIKRGALRDEFLIVR